MTLLSTAIKTEKNFCDAAALFRRAFMKQKTAIVSK